MKAMTRKGMTLLVAGMALTAACGVAQAETRLAVQDSTGAVDQMVVTDKGNIGIGTSSPGMAIQIDRAGTTGDTSMMFRNAGTLPYNAYNSSAFFFMRNNDKSVNAGLPNSGDRLGSMSFGSVLPTSSFKYGANISSFASGVWTSTFTPGYLSFQTTGSNDASPIERVRLDPQGNLGIGTTAPSQKLEVKGGIRLNTSAAKPATCDATTRGVIWVTQGGSNAADSVDVCLKDASNNYGWVKLN